MQILTNPSAQVAMMNTVFGNPAGVISAPDWTAIDRQMNIIESEFHELKLAVAARRIHGVGGIRDGIADLNVTNLGMAHVLGVDSDADMLEVFKSNMSKLITNEDELAASIDKYGQWGVEVYAEGEYPRMCIKSVKDQTGSNGEFYKKGKFLKGINFKEPKLEADHVE
jgi:hypothetical protein